MKKPGSTGSAHLEMGRLRGGVPLKISPDSEEELKRPGLMLLFDQTGKLNVSTETEDQEFYRIYSYSEERGE